MSAVDSPDVRSDSGSGGVRRLNRLPLLIVAGVILVMGGVIAYTMNERSEQDAASQKTERKKVESVSLDTVFTNVQDGGLIAAAPLPIPVDAPFPVVSKEPSERAEPGRLPSSETPGDQDVYAREWEVYRQQTSQIQQAKLQAASNALTAAATVPATRPQNESGNEGGGAGDGAPASPMDAAAGLQAGLSSLLGRMGGQGGSGLVAGGSGGGEGDANNAAGKVNWLSSAANPAHYLASGRVEPVSEFELKTGSVIPGVMIGGINSDLPGQIVGQVRENVYDTATGQHLLIPQGARLVGTYDNQITRGQSRVLVAWNRIIYPDGSSLDMEGMPGADQAGYAGFSDKVDNHYGKVFGDAMLMSLFAAGIQLSQPQSNSNNGSYDSQQVIAASIGQQLGQTGQQLAQQNMRIQPTLKIRPGFRFAIMVTKDMIIAPWVPRQ